MAFDRDDFDFSIEELVPMPAPGEKEGVRLSFQQGKIHVSFFQGESPLSVRSVRHPALLPLSRWVRSDGTLSVASALAFLERYDAGRIPDTAEVDMDPMLYRLSPVDQPEALTLEFIFDGIDALSLLVVDQGNAYLYDGRGIFLSAKGDYFTLPAVTAVDSFLDKHRQLKAAHFGIFFKFTLPRLSLAFTTSVSLTLTDDKPVFFTPAISPNHRPLMRVHWRIPYKDINFLGRQCEFCEAYGRLMPSSSILASLSAPFCTDGEVLLDKNSLEEMKRLYDRHPALFASSPSRLPFPAPTSPKNSLSYVQEIPIPPKPSQKPRTLSLAGACRISCRVTQKYATNIVRSRQLSAFMHKYREETGAKEAHEAYSALAPSFNDLTPSQRDTYFYARACYLRGDVCRVDYSYLLLLVYEACNLPERLDFLIFLWKTNRQRFQRLDLLLPGILRDYVTLFCPELSVSDCLERVGISPIGLPYFEMFLDFFSAKGVEKLPYELYPRLSAYEFTKSRFFGDHKELMVDALRRVLIAADRYMRDYTSGGLFASFPIRKVSFRVSACSPAIMTEENSYELQYSYDSCWGNPELLKTIGNLFKYTEKHLRSQLKFRGSLKVEPLEEGLEKALLQALRPRKETPALQLDIHRAISIEAESWDTTNRLIRESGVEEELPLTRTVSAEPLSMPTEDGSAIPAEETDSPYQNLLRMLTPEERTYSEYLLTDPEAGLTYLSSRFLLPETVEEAINEKALELTGDILIENHAIIEEYRTVLADLTDQPPERR